MTRAGLALGIVLMLALVVDGSLLLQQTATTNPDAKIPVTLAAVGGVNTVLGTSLTNASIGSVTPVVLPLLASAADVLTIQRGAANWSVQLRVIGASLSGGDSVTMTLVRTGSTSQAVTVTPSTTLPVTSGAMPLTSTGNNITVTAASGVIIVGGCGGLGTCTLTMQLIITGSGASNPVVTYPFTLRAT